MPVRDQLSDAHTPHPQLSSPSVHSKTDKMRNEKDMTIPWAHLINLRNTHNEDAYLTIVVKQSASFFILSLKLRTEDLPHIGHN